MLKHPAATFEGFRIYPRGFLGASLGVTPMEVLRPYQEQVQSHQFHPKMFKPSKADVEINRNIEEVWSAMIRHQGKMLEFDFREKLLTVALGAFGTQDFKLWVNTNIRGPSTGELHAEFIEDTLLFIASGKRRLAVMTWLPLLTLSDLKTNANVPTALINSFFIQPNDRGECNVNLVDVLQRWCHHEGGFEDLIQTLHVLFGDIIP